MAQLTPHILTSFTLSEGGPSSSGFSLALAKEAMMPTNCSSGREPCDVGGTIHPQGDCVARVSIACNRRPELEDFPISLAAVCCVILARPNYWRRFVTLLPYPSACMDPRTNDFSFNRTCAFPWLSACRARPRTLLGSSSPGWICPPSSRRRQLIFKKPVLLVLLNLRPSWLPRLILTVPFFAHIDSPRADATPSLALYIVACVVHTTYHFSPLFIRYYISHPLRESTSPLPLSLFSLVSSVARGIVTSRMTV